jgi:hypothetical protein
MLRASIEYARQRRETLLAVINFGASSVYWLGLALVLEAAAYGAMMTLQAAVMLVATVLTLRTHDLVFFLMSQHDFHVDQAYRRATTWEILTVATILLISTGGALAYFGPSQPLMIIGVAAFAFATALGSSHGGSIARLRFNQRADLIARADLMSITAWAGCCAVMVSSERPVPIMLLLVGAIPNLVRTIALMGAARHGSHLAKTFAAGTPRLRREILVFLMGGQVANAFKNAIVPIETIILAAVASPASVAMYRLARALLGPANAAMNVAYQRSYPVLSRPSPPAERDRLLRLIRRNALLTCLIFYPISATAALAYSWYKPDFALVPFQLMTLATFLALLPAAHQQGSFAILSVAGDHKAVGLAYTLSVLCLAVTFGILWLVPSLVVFMLGIITAALIRSWFLDRASLRVSHRSSPPPDQGDELTDDFPSSINVGS